MKPRTAILGAISAVLVLAACVEQTTAGRAATPSAKASVEASVKASVKASPQRYEIRATVMENALHGPQLCYRPELFVGGRPRVCGGPDIVGWDWSKVKSQTEKKQRTRFGDYLLTGTWDGTRFSLTEPAKPGDAKRKTKSPDYDFTPPCTAPVGGWKSVDPKKATSKEYERAFQRVEKGAGFAGGWIFELPVKKGAAPHTLLVMRFTGNLPAHEREIRKTWGGPLCLTTAERSQAELRQVSEKLGTLPNLVSVGTDVVRNAAQAQLLVVTSDIQRDVNRRFGAGVVHLRGLMQPIP
jgi:hypothetical protein